MAAIQTNGKGACGHAYKYWDEFDSYYCEPCDAWTEEKCRDPGCEFCSKRPERPSLAV